MQKIERLLETIYERRICNQFDHVMPIIGDEGMGKSTLIVESALLYQQIKDEEQDPEAILDSIVYTRDGLKEALATFDRRSLIAVPDAARVLHKREFMQTEQIELEKDFFDVRTKEFLILLGFQDWDSIPTFLQERRAKNALFIPKRGVVRGFNRTSLDKRVRNESWPPADLTDTFPSLEGTDIWDKYRELDRKKKDERMHGSGESDENNEMTPQDVVEEIKSNGDISEFSRHLNTGATIIDADLIKHDYPDLTNSQADQVKKVLERDFDLGLNQGGEREVATDGGGGNPP